MIHRNGATDSGLQVRGTLAANGTAAKPGHCTGPREDSGAGDTDGDDANTIPPPATAGLNVGIGLGDHETFEAAWTQPHMRRSVRFSRLSLRAEAGAYSSRPTSLKNRLNAPSYVAWLVQIRAVDRA